VQLSGNVTLAANPPAAYTLPGDSGVGSPFSNTTTMGFSPRGLPCKYDTGTTPATCTTPAANYFVYYLKDAHANSQGWAAVVVTKAGRSRVLIWDGATWR
jgi:hypothetical protein